MVRRVHHNHDRHTLPWLRRLNRRVSAVVLIGLHHQPGLSPRVHLSRHPRGDFDLVPAHAAIVHALEDLVGRPSSMPSRPAAMSSGSVDGQAEPSRSSRSRIQAVRVWRRGVAILVIIRYTSCRSVGRPGRDRPVDVRRREGPALPGRGPSRAGTRPGRDHQARPAAVFVSVDDLASLEETLDIMADRD